MRDFSVFIGACLLSLLLTPLVEKIARRNKILDYPETRKMHERPTPLLGGLAVYLAFLIAIYFLPAHSPSFAGVLLGSSLILVVSIIDDIRDLPTGIRLIVQFLGAFIMIIFGVRVSFLPPGLWGDIGEIVITFIWVVGITNAMNFLDGLDGLVGGLGVITGVFFFVVAIQVHQPYFGFLALAMAGACLGFLPYNFPAPFLYVKRLFQGTKEPVYSGEDRARIFLGDAGATFLGAFYAGISVMGDLAKNNVVALTVPLLLLGIPIFDMTFITLMRIREKKISDMETWLAYAGKDHFHHRLVDLGFSKEGAVLFIYCMALTLGITAIVLRDAAPLDAFLLLLKAALIFILIALLMITGMRTARAEGRK
ncbi:MAG: MraY family glycosyltransferase [Candidatus Omnitrophota bacterium]